MGSLLGSWRGSLTTMMLILMALISYVVLNGQPHAEKARHIRTELATKTVKDLHQRDLLPEGQYQTLLTAIPQVPARTKFSKSYVTSEEFHAEMADPYTALVKEVTSAGTESLEDRGKGAAAAQQFVTIYNQMTVPVALREILPIGLTGVFCALMYQQQVVAILLAFLINIAVSTHQRPVNGLALGEVPWEEVAMNVAGLYHLQLDSLIAFRSTQRRQGTHHQNS